MHLSRPISHLRTVANTGSVIKSAVAFTDSKPRLFPVGPPGVRSVPRTLRQGGEPTKLQKRQFIGNRRFGMRNICIIFSRFARIQGTNSRKSRLFQSFSPKLAVSQCTPFSRPKGSLTGKRVCFKGHPSRKRRAGPAPACATGSPRRPSNSMVLYFSPRLPLQARSGRLPLAPSGGSFSL